MIVPAVHENSVQYVVGRVIGVGLLQEGVKVKLGGKFAPVVDLDVGVGSRIILKPHQLQNEHRWQREEDNTFLRLLNIINMLHHSATDVSTAKTQPLCDSLVHYAKYSYTHLQSMIASIVFVLSIHILHCDVVLERLVD